MKLTKRHFLGVALVLAASYPKPATAMSVIDFKRWWDMYLMLEDVKQLTGRVSASLERVKNAATQLGKGNIVDDILITQRYLTSDIRAISYSVDTVTTQFETIFPSQEAASHVAPSDVPALRSNWDQQLQESGLAAARAQSSLSRLDTNTRAALDVLERSKATTGGTMDEGSELAKLQAMVELLGIVNSDLTILGTTLAVSERVNAVASAAEASDLDLEAARAERVMRDYGARQPIPEIDPRILQRSSP